MDTANKIIKTLKLKPHPKEGGYFREIYRSAESLKPGALPKRYKKGKSLATAIYYLLTPGTFSSVHKLSSDEIFHFYFGDPVEMLLLFPDGSGKAVTLGGNVLKGMFPQVIVKKNTWQGSRLVKGGKFALLGTTMSPGFDYEDYEDGKKEALIKKYPKFKKMISALMR
ncbi:MAG: cupin domain-containing protein [Elusimicrobia bacterium]|nr:cupin domain-containing protein [Candidatus Liberimonas magnetica]